MQHIPKGPKSVIYVHNLCFVNSDILNFKTNYIANYIYLLQAAHIFPVIGHFYMQHIPKGPEYVDLCP